MLKNKKERELFIKDEENWQELEKIDSIGMRIMQLKLTKDVSLVKFQRKLTEEDIIRYAYLEVEKGSFIDTEFGARYFELVNGAINPYQGMSLNRAIDFLKDVKQEDK